MRQRRLGREPGARHPQPRLRRFGIGAPDPIESGDRGAEIAVGQRRSGGVDRRSRTVIAGQADASDRDQPASPIERLLPPCRRRRRRARRAGELAGEIVEPAAQCRAARHPVARGVGQRRCPGGQRRIAAGEPVEGAVRRLEGLAVHDRLTHLLHRQQQGGTGAIGARPARGFAAPAPTAGRRDPWRRRRAAPAAAAPCRSRRLCRRLALRARRPAGSAGAVPPRWSRPRPGPGDPRRAPPPAGRAAAPAPPGPP